MWVARLVRLLRRRRPDVVHSHSPVVGAIAAPLVRAGLAGRRAVHVYTEHNRWPAYRRVTRLADRLTMGLHAAVWTVSEEVRDCIRPARLRRRTSPLVHGVDVGAIAARGDGVDRGKMRRELVIADEAVVAIHVANLRPKKAHDVLLDAFDRAASACPDLHLVAVGLNVDHDGPEWFVERVARSEHRERIHLLGRRGDAVELMAASDLVVLSSDHEGLPVVVMEALALGRPVVATAVGGLPEAVGDGRGGLVVPPRDPAALAAAMVDLAADADRRRALGAAARAQAVRFDGRRAVAEMEETYRRFAADRQRRTA